MGNKFIYVFSKKDRDELLAKGLTLLKEDVMNNMYIFFNEQTATFSLNELGDSVCYVTTNTLSF